MEKTRRDLILESVRKYTSEGILNNTFNFDQCNAFDIALDHKLDRSNVSRILNQLFNEFLLIKVEGRPTLYLSKEIISGQFHFNNIPQIITNRESLKNLFVFNTPSEEPVLRNDLDIIGNGFEESLSSLIGKLSPAIYFHQSNPLLIAIQGEKGVGKKYFCSRLFDLGIKTKRFPKKSKIYTIDYRSVCENLEGFKEQISLRSISIIVIEIFTKFSENDIYRLRNDIFHMFRNENRKMPIHMFLVDKSVDNFAYFSQLTPYFVQYPNIRERTAKEMIELVLTFIQEEADNINFQIKVTSNAIASFICAEYTYNLFQLRNEIIYSISNNLYSASLSGHDPIILTHENVSKNIMKNNRTSDVSFYEQVQTSLSQLIPEIIDFYPGKECEPLKTLRNTQLASTMFITPKLSTITEKASEDVENARTKLLDSSSIEMHSRLYQVLTPVFAKTKMKYDKQLMSLLYKKIQNMLDNTFAYNFSLDDLSYKESTQSMEVSNNIIAIIENKFQIHMLDVYASYIRNYIYYALKSIRYDSITTLIIAHGERLAENYAQHLNRVIQNRSFFSFDYNLYYQQHDIKEFNEKIYKLMNYIDLGKGVLLIGDYDPLTTLDKSIVAETNIPAFSLYPLSLPLLYDTSELVNLKTMHLGILLTKVINNKREHKQFLKESTYMSKSERSNSPILAKFIKSFPHINTAKSNESLYQVLVDVCGTLNISVTNDLIISFLFHGNCMLERCTTKQKIHFHLLDQYLETYDYLFTCIKNRLHQVRDFLTLSIADEEIAVLSQIFYNYLEFQTIEEAKHTN